MKEVIDRILEGRFEYENGELTFSESRIEITLFPGEDRQGSFMITGRKDRVTEGFVYTSDNRMECLTKHFSGAGEEIGYVFHGKGMEEGDVLKGAFSIVSNQGEYTIPFVVMVSHPVITAGMGPVKNLFHFANLAKSSWSEAVQLFYSPGFGALFQGGDRKYAELYRGLSRYYGNERNVEEFLIGIHKKQKVQYLIDEDKIRLNAEDCAGRHEVLLVRNGWGYTRLQAEVLGDFITVDKTVLYDDDFLGNRCAFYYYIDPEKLHKGLNYGRLRFHNTFVSIELPIEVKKEDEVFKKGQIQRKKQELLIQIMELYEAFRMKKISTKTWLQKNYGLTDEWTEMDDADPEPKLYRVHLLITEGRMSEAGGMLDQARNTILQSKNMDQAVWCYYLYLSTLQKRDESYVNTIAQEVADAFEKEPGNWRLGWLLLYLSPEYDASYSKKWLFIKEQFERGCRSPVFYIEALLLMRLEPSLFMELGAFEMQVLRYAAKHDLLTDEIMMQLHYLAPRMREYSETLLAVLKKGYEMRKDTETLQNICTMLIRGNRRGEEDFVWYAEGVEENLRITKLYEYYMYSLNTEELIRLPKVIYMYFAYHNTLSWEKSAFLYASLLQNKDSLPDLYENEQFHIQEFVMKMVQDGRVNEHLAYLYKMLIKGEVMLTEAGEKLSPLLFSVRVQTDDERMKRAVVLYPREVSEKSYPLTEGEAVFPVYGEEYTLLLEDGTGNRYVPEEGFRIERLFEEPGLISEAEKRDQETVSLQLRLCGGYTEGITGTNVSRYRRIFESDDVSEEYKNRILPGLLQFYYDSGRTEELDSLLDGLDPRISDSERRGEIIHYLLLRGRLEKAQEWIREYGVNGIDPKTLLKFASEMIEYTNQVEDETVLFICFYVFGHGRYDLTTLKYLMDYYHGSTKVMRDIWKTSRKAGLDVHDFGERILYQMLYSGCYIPERMDIFKDCLKREMDRPLEKAFIAQCCYDCFVKDKVTEETVFEDLERLLRLGEPLQKVCLLAYTQYYAEHIKEIKDSRKKLLENSLLKLLEERAVLPYFKEYADQFSFMRRFYDKTILEYRTKPGRKVWICYTAAEEEEIEESYRKEEMKEVYDGIFSCSFVLFFGEKLFYYIMEEYEDEGGMRSELTGSGNISRSDTENEMSEGRFRILNDIATAEALQDYDTLGDMMKEYERTDYMQEALFKLCR